MSPASKSQEGRARISMAFPIYGSVKDAKKAAPPPSPMIYVPTAIRRRGDRRAVERGPGLVICITEGIPVRDMIRNQVPHAGQANAAGRDRTAPG